MADRIVKGFAHLCPANCYRYENTTGFDYSPAPKVTPPPDGDGVGSVLVKLLKKRTGLVFNSETGELTTPKYARATAFLHAGTDGFECVEEDVLKWRRTGPAEVTVTYRTPHDCNWKGTTLRPAVPPTMNQGGGSFPVWNWLIDRLYPNGYIVQPDAGEDENKARAYFPLDKVRENTFDWIFCLPGTYAAAGEKLMVPGGGIRERLLFSPFGTPNLLGGWIIGPLENREYLVDIFGRECRARASDYRDWAAGDWVFTAQNLCGSAEQPGSSKCNGDEENMIKYGPQGILDPEKVSLIIVPIQVGALGPSDPVAVFAQYEWGAFLDACIMRASIIEVDPDHPRGCIEIDGLGRLDDVDIKYIGRDESSLDNGQRFFGPDQEVLVLNKSGRKEPSTHELVVFHACNPVSPVLYFYLDRTHKAFLWDTGTNDFPFGVTNAEGEEITSWPVSWLDLDAWMTANLEQKSRTNTILWPYPREAYCQGEACIADSNGIQLTAVMDPTSRTEDDVCAGPHPNHATCDWKDNHGTKHTNCSEWPPGYYAGIADVDFGLSGGIAFGNRYRLAWSEDLVHYEDFVLNGSGSVSGSGLYQCYAGGTDPLGQIDDVLKTSDLYWTRTEEAEVAMTAPGNLTDMSGILRRYQVGHRQVLWHYIGTGLGRYVDTSSRTLDDETDQINYQILCSGLTGLGWNYWAKLLIWATFDSGISTDPSDIEREPNDENFSVQCLQADVTAGGVFENINPFTMPENPALAAAVKELMLDPEGEYLSSEKISGPFGAAGIRGIRVCMPGTGGNFIMPDITLYDWK